MSPTYNIVDYGDQSGQLLKREFRFVLYDARGKVVAGFNRKEDATHMLEFVEPSATRKKFFPITRSTRGGYRVTMMEEPIHGQLYQGVMVNRETEEEERSATVEFDQGDGRFKDPRFFNDEGEPVHMDDYDFLEVVR